MTIDEYMESVPMFGSSIEQCIEEGNDAPYLIEEAERKRKFMRRLRGINYREGKKDRKYLPGLR
jgi:hypothetical protein